MSIRFFTAQMLVAVLLIGTLADVAISQQLLSDVASKGVSTEQVFPQCAGGEFKTTGNSSENGAAGNFRSFSVGTINVKASAFARRVSNGSWETAYLGAFSSGLGVTDSSENGSNDTHKVDNIGTYKNYVLFEFSQKVVVNRAALDAIGGDSDITVWIGNAMDPYNNHITLSDALLTGYGSENNNGGSTTRWADINAGSVAGNVLVIAARADHSDDAFKIEALDIDCPPAPCGLTEIVTTGNSAGDGPDGNILTFSNGGISVKTSAFSKRNSDGLWQTAFQGAFSPGLGVTDRGEGNGDADRHKVDNIGDRKNYVLYEFNQDVIVDSVSLDSIGDDSDITVWIGSGSDPFNNHLTLSDALLNSFGASEDNNTSNGSPRTADINSGLKAGNVLVVAASTSDVTPEDAFKIKNVKVSCADPERARVTIIKEVATFGGGTSANQQFAFTATGLGTANFSLIDQNSMGPDRFINANVTEFGAGNAMTVTESLTLGWTLADISCVETGGMANTTVNFAQQKATIIAEPGESIVCTFRNTQLAPSAAHASISGQAVTAEGRGIYGATLVLTDVATGESRMTRTNMFGYYTFDDIEIGSFYVLTIDHKRHYFASNTRSFTLVESLSRVDFIETF